MAVYERAYRGYDGEMTASWSRFLIIPRYALSRVFQSKLFLIFFVLCFVFPIAAAASIYAMNNLDAVAERLGISLTGFEAVELSGWHARFFLMIQGVGLSFVLSLIVGPALVSADMRNNGLPLYLCRPFSRSEYILGKFAVLALLLSGVTWIPGMLLIGEQAYLAGGDWISSYWSLPLRFFVASWVWILLVSLVSLAVSATMRLKTFAAAAMFGVFFVAAAFASIVAEIFEMGLARMLSVHSVTQTLWISLLGIETTTPLPVIAAWISFAVMCGLSILVLYRKVQAYEVVR